MVVLRYNNDIELIELELIFLGFSLLAHFGYELSILLLISSLAVKDGKTWRKLKFVAERSTALSAKGTEHF